MANDPVADWAGVEAQADAIMAARAEEYDPAVRANLDDLIAFLKATGRPAPFVGQGYWPTFNLSWDIAGAANLAIEVFGDRYEVYRFSDGQTDIRHESHAPGDTSFSDAFVSELPPPLDDPA